MPLEIGYIFMYLSFKKKAWIKKNKTCYMSITHNYREPHSNYIYASVSTALHVEPFQT